GGWARLNADRPRAATRPRGALPCPQMVGGGWLRAAALAACVAGAVGGTVLCGAGVARASQPLGELNLTNVSLSVNAQSEALITYTRPDGKVRHVLAWGAINAYPPSQDVAQVR